MKDQQTEAALEAAALKFMAAPGLTLRLVHSNVPEKSDQVIDWGKLREPFKADEIEWRIGRSGETNGKIWAMCLAYVTARAIQDRLDEVIGPSNWRVSYHLLESLVPKAKPDDEAVTAGVICKLEIRINGDWVAKEDGSEQSDMESFKGGISGALKRAAVLWGVGRYLYGLTEGFAQIVERGNGAHYATTKDKKPFYWQPPQLPDWALPSRQFRDPPPKQDPPKEAPKEATPKPPAAGPKPLPKPSSSEKSDKGTPPSPKPTPSSSPTSSSPSDGKPGTQSRSPFAAEPPKDVEREGLMSQLMKVYQPFLTKWPTTQFPQLMMDRYQTAETRLMTTEQLKDLVHYLESQLMEDAKKPPAKSAGKPPTDTERHDLWQASKANGWTAPQMKEYLQAAFGVDSSKKLNRAQFQLMQGISPKVKFDLAIAEFAGLEEDVP